MNPDYKRRDVLALLSKLTFATTLATRPTHSFSRQVSTNKDDHEFICSTLPLEDESPEISTGVTSEPKIALGNPLNFSTLPFGVATAKKRWKFTHGMTPNTGKITLGIHFHNGSEDQKNELIERANLWIDERLSKRLSFKFNVKEQDSQIRVHFDKEGPNNSAVGVDATRSKYFSKPTMRIGNMRSVAHEFGHALCLRHEHRHEEFPFTFKEDLVIAEMEEYGWKPAKTRRNILKPLSKSKCLGDPSFNKDSVMIYDIPSRWIEEGVAFSPNREISERDRRCVYALYEA